jgi:hypothetical protein
MFMEYNEYIDFKAKVIDPHVNMLQGELSGLKLDNARYGKIFEAYTGYLGFFSVRMVKPVLDRHKEAACMCLAICEAHPFDDPIKIADDFSPRVNEFLAVQVALNVLEIYIKREIIKENKLYSANSPKLEFPNLTRCAR